MTLLQAALGPQTLLKQGALALGGALFVALAAQVSIGWPVPMTLQTLAVLIVGLTFGARLGAVTLLTYLGYGALGLPVFANGAAAAAFFGPTAGFLVGFVLMAYLAGLMVDRGLRGVVPLAVGAIVISALLYVPGLLWPMALAQGFGLEGGWIGQGFADYYWPYFMQPFLIGDAIKAVLAALIVSGVSLAFRSR